LIRSLIGRKIQFVLFFNEASRNKERRRRGNEFQRIVENRTLRRERLTEEQISLQECDIFL